MGKFYKKMGKFYKIFDFSHVFQRIFPPISSDGRFYPIIFALFHQKLPIAAQPMKVKDE